jgi:hypothetical protein
LLSKRNVYRYGEEEEEDVSDSLSYDYAHLPCTAGVDGCTS